MARKKDEEELILFVDREVRNVTLASHAPGKPPIKAELRQMDGVEISAWMNFSETRAVYNKDGTQTGVSDYDGYFEYLIAMCLYQRGTETAFTEDEIAAFPAPTKLALYKTCCEMNGLRPEAPVEEKKSLPRRNGSGTASSNGRGADPSTRPNEPTPAASSSGGPPSSSGSGTSPAESTTN